MSYGEDIGRKKRSKICQINGKEMRNLAIRALNKLKLSEKTVLGLKCPWKVPPDHEYLVKIFIK